MKKEQTVYESRGKIWTIAIIAALVASLAVFGAMMQMEHNMLADYEKVPVIVAGKKIPRGTVITAENRGDYFAEIEMDKKVVPANELISWEEAEGMVAEIEIAPGVLLADGMFETMEEITAEMTSPVIAGLRAEDLYQIVGGTLRTGDRINIYHITEEGEVSLDWKKLYVQEAFDNGGNSIPASDSHTPAQRLNVYLNEQDVEMFYSELEKGNLRIVKICD